MPGAAGNAPGGPLPLTDCVNLSAVIASALPWKGDIENALAHSLRAQQIFESLVGSYPDEDVAVLSVAISGVKHGDLLGHPSFPNAGRSEDALNTYRAALVTVQPLAERADGPDGALRYMAMIHERIGTMLSQSNRFDEALQHYETSLSVREQLAAARPGNANTRRDVAVAIEKIGDVRLAHGDAEAALPNYQKALEMYRQLASADPENANAVRTLAIGLENLSEALLVNGDQQSARNHLDEVVQIRQKLVANNPGNERLASELQTIIERIESL